MCATIRNRVISRGSMRGSLPRCKHNSSAYPWATTPCRLWSALRCIPVGLRANRKLDSSARGSTSELSTNRELIGSVNPSAFMRTQLISCRLPKADSALLRSSLFHHLCRFVSFSSGGLASARQSLCRGLGSRWFMERFHGNALVTHFQHGQVLCTARQLKDYAVTRCRLHQRAPQR
jgi:hypothetical protein